MFLVFHLHGGDQSSRFYTGVQKDCSNAYPTYIWKPSSVSSKLVRVALACYTSTFTTPDKWLVVAERKRQLKIVFTITPYKLSSCPNRIGLVKLRSQLRLRRKVGIAPHRTHIIPAAQLGPRYRSSPPEIQPNPWQHICKRTIPDTKSK